MEAVGLPVLGKDGKWLDWNIDCCARRRRGGDPHAYVISANIHRRHLTTEQKRDLIAKLIKATPEKSDLQIAKTVKASPTTVGTVRAKMEARGDVSKLETRRDTKGRKQPAKKIKPRHAQLPSQSNKNNAIQVDTNSERAPSIDSYVARMKVLVEIAIALMPGDADHQALVFEKMRAALAEME